MKKILVFIVVLLLAIFFARRFWPGDENRIRAAICEGEKELEQEKIDDVMAHVWFGYRDSYGLSYVYIKKMLAMLFVRVTDLSIESKIADISIAGDSSKACVHVRVTATLESQRVYLLGDAQSPAVLTFYFRKENLKWLLNSMDGLPAFSESL